MTTRAELRGVLRQRLEDGAQGAPGGPLWGEAALDDATAEGVRAYGARVPREAVAELAVVAGARHVPVAAPVGAGGRIVRVLDGAGEVQSWRWWDGALVLARSAAAGTWRIEFLGARAVPVDDAGAVDVLPRDEAIVLALALACALRRRAVEEAKRGGDAAERAGAPGGNGTDRGGAAASVRAPPGARWLAGVTERAEGRERELLARALGREPGALLGQTAAGGTGGT